MAPQYSNLASNGEASESKQNLANIPLTGASGEYDTYYPQDATSAEPSPGMDTMGFEEQGGVKGISDETMALDEMQRQDLVCLFCDMAAYSRSRSPVLTRDPRDV